MEPLQLRFLGDIHIEQGNNTYVDQLPGKAIALICYLAVTNEAQTRNTLASLLWSDFPEHRRAAICVIPSPHCAVRH